MATKMTVKVPKTMTPKIVVHREIKMSYECEISGYEIEAFRIYGGAVVVKAGCQEHSVSHWRKHAAAIIRSYVDEAEDRDWYKLYASSKGQLRLFYPRHDTDRKEATARKRAAVEALFRAFLARVDAEFGKK